MRQKAMLVSELLPHYRYGVFAELERSIEYRWTFAAGQSDRNSSIPAIERSLLNDTVTLGNRRLGPLLWQVGLLSLLARERPAVAVFTGDAGHASTWVGAILARALGAKVYFWTIGWHRPESGLKRWVRLRFYRLAHGLMLYGETGRRLGEALGYPGERMWVIHNAAASSLHRTDRDVTALKPDALPAHGPTIGVVVRQNASKRLDLVILAAAELARRGRLVNVLLVGEGPENEKLRTLAESSGVRAYLPGPAYSARDLKAVYAAIDVTVIPCQAGLSVMQSLAHGVPVITDDDPYTQAPEADAVVHGVTGARYRAGSVEDLAKAIEHWLDLVDNDAVAIGRACREEIESRWTPAAQSRAILSILRARDRR